jgi:hypothetical protein
VGWGIVELIQSIVFYNFKNPLPHLPPLRGRRDQ